jgi:hypothetical protein
MKILQFIGGIVFVFLLLLSCSEDGDQMETNYTNGRIQLRYNQQFRVSDSFMLEITELSDDRCPVGVVCSEAGLVSLTFRFNSTGEISEKVLYYSDFPNRAKQFDTISSFRVEIVNVNPLRVAGQSINEFDNYTVTLRVDPL